MGGTPTRTEVILPPDGAAGVGNNGFNVLYTVLTGQPFRVRGVAVAIVRDVLAGTVRVNPTIRKKTSNEEIQGALNAGFATVSQTLKVSWVMRAYQSAPDDQLIATGVQQGVRSYYCPWRVLPFDVEVGYWCVGAQAGDNVTQRVLEIEFADPREAPFILSEV